MTLLFETLLDEQMNNARIAGTENPSAAENGEVKSAASSEKFVSETTRCSSSVRENPPLLMCGFSSKMVPGSR